MTITAEIVPFEQVFGLDGLPLDNGKIYIGTVNLDPQYNPVPVFWDAAGTIPAVQPIRTVAGYISYNGAPARIYANGNYSLRVATKNDQQVYYVPDYFLTGNQSALTPLTGISQLQSYLQLRAYTGSATTLYLTGRTNDQDGAAGTFSVDEADTTSADNDGTILIDALGRRWKRQGISITPQMFGADPTGVADSYAAIIAAGAAANKYPLVFDGIFKISAGIDFSAVPVIHSNNAIIRPSFDAGAAVNYIAASGQLIENMKLLGNMTVEWPNQDWTKERTSFYFSNVYNGEFHVSSRKSTRGLVCLGNNKGVVHNNFHLGDFFNNLVGVWLDSASSAGWCNMNRFHGGFFYGDGTPAGSLYESRAGHIYTADSPYKVNGNVFLYPSLEWGNLTGFRMARLGGLRNKLYVGYTETSGGDTTWFNVFGNNNMIDVQSCPYAIGYDPDLPAASNRIDASLAIEPWIVGQQGYYDAGGVQSTYVNDSVSEATALFVNKGGTPLRAQNKSDSSKAGLEILNLSGGIGVSLPAAGLWTVFNGTRKVNWNAVSAPTAGNWTRGDIAFNVTPSAGQPMGWMCTASGTPGTWAAMPNLV